MYTRQKIETTWNGKRSDAFNVANGVKQGGILSPILFCIYMDELLLRINNSGLGCHIGHIAYSGLGYADDVTVLAPTLEALQAILYICEQFAREYNVMWNCGKTKCMRVGSGGVPPLRPITLNGTVLKWKQKVKHLGNFVRHDLNDHDDIMYKKGLFVSYVNKLNVKFRTVPTLLRGKLFQTYCCSWSGCQIWNIDSRDAQNMQTEWNKAVRRTLGLPYQTHRNLLPLIVQSRSFAEQHKSRVCKFIETFMTSENSRVAFIGERAKVCAFGTLGRNLYKCTTKDDDNSDMDLLAKSSAIRDLIEVLGGTKSVEGMSVSDVGVIIEDLCCN